MKPVVGQSIIYHDAASLPRLIVHVLSFIAIIRSGISFQQRPPEFVYNVLHLMLSQPRICLVCCPNPVNETWQVRTKSYPCLQFLMLYSTVVTGAEVCLQLVAGDCVSSVSPYYQAATALCNNSSPIVCLEKSSALPVVYPMYASSSRLYYRNSAVRRLTRHETKLDPDPILNAVTN